MSMDEVKKKKLKKEQKKKAWSIRVNLQNLSYKTRIIT
jgi:hypothetical protein